MKFKPKFRFKNYAGNRRRLHLRVIGRQVTEILNEIGVGLCVGVPARAAGVTQEARTDVEGRERCKLLLEKGGDSSVCVGGWHAGEG